MLIDCPNCSTAYDVPAARLRPNLRLRCGRCATEWLAPFDTVPEEAVAAEAVAAPEPRLDPTREPALQSRPLPGFLTPGPRLAPEPEPAPKKSRSYALMTAWLISLVILAGGGWAAVHWKAPIMQSWPPATRAYAAIGLLRTTPMPPAHF